MEYEWVLFFFLGLICFQLWWMVKLLSALLYGFASVFNKAAKQEIADMADDLFTKELNRYREEALRRGK